MREKAGEVVLGQSILYGSLKAIQVYPNNSGALNKGMNDTIRFAFLKSDHSLEEALDIRTVTL